MADLLLGPDAFLFHQTILLMLRILWDEQRRNMKHNLHGKKSIKNRQCTGTQFRKVPTCAYNSFFQEEALPIDFSRFLAMFSVFNTRTRARQDHVCPLQTFDPEHAMIVVDKALWKDFGKAVLGR